MKKALLTVLFLSLTIPAFANTCTRIINATEAQLDTLIIGMDGTGDQVCGTEPVEGEEYTAPTLAECTVTQKKVWINDKLWNLVMKKYRRGEKIEQLDDLQESTFDPAD